MKSQIFASAVFCAGCCISDKLKHYICSRLRLENITIIVIILILFTYGISALMMVYDDIKTLRTTIMDEAAKAEFSALFNYHQLSSNPLSPVT